MAEEAKNSFDRQRLRSRVRAVLVFMMVVTVCVANFLPATCVNEKVFSVFVPLATAAVMYFFKNTGDKAPDE